VQLLGYFEQQLTRNRSRPCYFDDQGIKPMLKDERSGCLLKVSKQPYEDLRFWHVIVPALKVSRNFVRLLNRHECNPSRGGMCPQGVAWWKLGASCSSM
jgi:hypothetical protein